MHQDLEKVKLLTRDLRDGKEFPRSPRATLAGYVLAARAVDKCRAVLADWHGDYHSNCPLDQRWLNFAEIDYGEFRLLVATGATDDEIAAWMSGHVVHAFTRVRRHSGKRVLECVDTRTYGYVDTSAGAVPWSLFEGRHPGSPGASGPLPNQGWG